VEKRRIRAEETETNRLDDGMLMYRIYLTDNNGDNVIISAGRRAAMACKKVTETLRNGKTGGKRAGQPSGCLQNSNKLHSPRSVVSFMNCLGIMLCSLVELFTSPSISLLYFTCLAFAVVGLRLEVSYSSHADTIR
jgi:hypothetical protein